MLTGGFPKPAAGTSNQALRTGLGGSAAVNSEVQLSCFLKSGIAWCWSAVTAFGSTFEKVFLQKISAAKHSSGLNVSDHLMRSEMMQAVFGVTLLRNATGAFWTRELPGFK